MQEVVFVKGQELDPFKRSGVVRTQFFTDEIDHLRHGDLVDDFVWLRVQSISNLGTIYLLFEGIVLNLRCAVNWGLPDWIIVRFYLLHIPTI